MREKTRIRGMVTVRVCDRNGCIKRKAPGWLGRLLGLRGRLMICRRHNIVTRQGDALIADALLPNPARPKVSGSGGFMQAGTGWTGAGAKNNTRCNAPAGSMAALDGGAPFLKVAWGAAGDTTVAYKATFPPGSLDAKAVNEICLLNGGGEGADCLAYAQISPPVDMTENDTLQVLWEITILGQ